jgi:hypothetical protein
MFCLVLHFETRYSPASSSLDDEGVPPGTTLYTKLAIGGSRLDFAAVFAHCTQYNPGWTLKIEMLRDYCESLAQTPRLRLQPWGHV